MRKTTAYLLVLLFLYNSLGYYLHFEVMRQRIRREMKEIRLKDPEGVIVLSLRDLLADPDFRWFDDEEFCYRGTLYDVIRQDNPDGEPVVYCKADSKETQLFSAFAKESKTKSCQSILDHIIKTALTRPSGFFCATVSSGLVYPDHAISFVSNHPVPPTPPPKPA